ncbi:hypothetical protein AYI69_g3417 [Smittium culicis]|uniref:Reverse transcriptase domain-containing protein n=1 Tax=Smittium culicis TaxID=133412 RepID=A0A1R1YJS7_9FUNG|nr:hypothetical protein AYI69_g3417 [Smittium culicis]
MGGTWRRLEGPVPRVSPSKSTADVPSASVQEEVKPRGQQSSDRRSRFLTIEEILLKDPGFYSQLFAIPKNTGGLRPVLDLRKLNQHVEEQNFKMEIMATICRTIRRKDYLTSLDLQDAFMHIIVYKNCRKYLRFYWNGRCFQFRFLPFGLSLIPLENDTQGSVNQDQGSLTRGKQATKRWENDVEMSRELYWESPVNVDCTASGSPYASPTSRIKESITVDAEIMEIDSHPKETCHSEPIDLSESPTRTSNNNSGDTNVEVCHLFSGTIGPINLAAGPSARKDDHDGSKKRKIAVLGKQELALDGF